MIRDDDPNLRVLRWRFQGLVPRLGQAALFGLLGWLDLRHPMVLVWLLAATTLSVVDAGLSRALYHRPDDRRLFAIATLSRLTSASAFSTLVFLFLLDRTYLGIAAAVFCGCAITLNNAIMTRGSRLHTLVLVGPSSAFLMLLPLAAALMGYHLGLLGSVLLAIGAAAYVAFIAILAQTLHREGERLQAALAALGAERDQARASKQTATAERARWRTLFQESPLPQVCFDASRLYELVRADLEAGVPRPGDRLAASFASLEAALNQVELNESNDAAHRLYRVERFEGAIPKAYFDASFVTGFCESLNGLTPDGVFPPFDARLPQADGRVAEVVVHVRILPEGRPWSTCLASYVDMTEHRAAERAQEEAMRAAEAASRAKSEFLAIMSHEIRTPLNGVLGMAQAMENAALSRVQRGRLDVIRQSGEALLAILNDVLDLSKIEAGKLELEIAPFELEGLARGAHAAFSGAAKAKGLDFELAIAPDALGSYLGDSARIRQILYNLISNAVKFTALGGVRVAISRTTTGVRASVADTGTGIAADRIGQLFHKFVQADSSTTRQFGGTGLGLAICKELTEAMGGTIEAVSEPGRGATFTVELPLEAVAGAEPTESRAAEAAADPDRVVRVLAAEDNPVNRLVLKTLLGQFGLEPTVVEDGQAAVEAWEAEDWDLILMDVQMPRLDGPSAARRIRALEAERGRARTPIIALTANAMTHQTEAYRAAGMDDVVTKPIEIRDLLRAINAVVGGAAEPAEVRKPRRGQGGSSSPPAQEKTVTHLSGLNCHHSIRAAHTPNPLPARGRGLPKPTP